MRQALSFFFFKLYKKIICIGFDLMAIPIAWYLSYWLRYNMRPFPSNFTSRYSLSALAILAVVQVACYYYFGVHRGLWRFFSLNDIIKIIKATFFAVLLAIPFLYLSFLLQQIPRSVLPLYGIISVVLLGTARLMVRSYWDDCGRKQNTSDLKRVLIVGAGSAGEGLVRELKRGHTYLPIGFVDDNPSKVGLEVHGIRVLGPISSLPYFVTHYFLDLIFIAIPSARSVTMRRIVDYCEAAKIPFLTLPNLSTQTYEHVEVNALRSVNIEDLLGRDEVQLEWNKISDTIKNKRILVTGGGGSIGSELCRQIIRLSPKSLLILDNSEFNLYKIKQELNEEVPSFKIDLALASITDASAVEFVFHQFRPQLVFHAAAFKHVPMLEGQVISAVLNNIIGTQIVAETSVALNVEKFILISTDKAVNPTNIMGTTKRVAEIYCQNLNERVKTQFITVRFGNVLGSTGSVVPLFQRQLQAGGPLTVTHPDIMRYFMTIPEAAQLILQAMVNGVGGEIFVLDMGVPIKISYLAEQMIRLAGKEPGRDIAITYIGLRPGEKLFEELFHIAEKLIPTKHEKLFNASFRRLEWQFLIQIMNELVINCNLHNNIELVELLKKLVPEFDAQLDLNSSLIVTSKDNVSGELISSVECLEIR